MISNNCFSLLTICQIYTEAKIDMKTNLEHLFFIIVFWIKIFGVHLGIRFLNPFPPPSDRKLPIFETLKLFKILEVLYKLYKAHDLGQNIIFYLVNCCFLHLDSFKLTSPHT